MQVKMFIWILGTVLLYVVFQAIYSGYYFWQSSKLIKTIYVGKRELGDEKKPQYRIFLTGDSIGAGVGASSFETSVGGRVAGYFAGERHVTFENKSVVGMKMRDLAKRDLPNEQQDLVVLIVSSNDLFRFANLDEFKVATKKVFENYSKIARRVIIVGPGRVFDSPAIPIVLRPVYRWQAEKYSSVIDDEIKKYENMFHVDPVHPPTGLEQVANWESVDKFHPGDSGHEYWFDLVKSAL